jgi:hypothetical protein
VSPPVGGLVTEASGPPAGDVRDGDAGVAAAVRRCVLTTGVGTLVFLAPTAWLLRDVGGLWIGLAASGVLAARLGRAWLNPLEARHLVYRDPAGAVLTAGGLPPRPDGRPRTPEECRMDSDDLVQLLARPREDVRRSRLGRALFVGGWAAGALAWLGIGAVAALLVGPDPAGVAACGLGAGLFAAGGALAWRHEQRRERALDLLESGAGGSAPTNPAGSQRLTQT